MRNLMILFIILPFACNAQKQITNGMSGKNVRDAINNNFDSTFNHTGTFYNIKDFGAAGDGVTDDRDAIYNTIEAAKGDPNAIVFFPKPNVSYKVNSIISVLNITGNLIIEGNGSFIDASETVSDASVLQLGGALSVKYYLDYNTAQNDNYLVCSQASNFARDDAISITTNDSSMAVSSGEEMNGEFARVEYVSNDTIYLYHNLYTTYLADSADFYKITASVKINGLKIEGNRSNDRLDGIYINGFQNVSVSQCEITGTRWVGILLRHSYGFDIYDNFTSGTDRPGAGYGIQIAGSQDGTVNNNRSYGCRHALSTGGTERMWVRNLDVSNNTFNNVLSFGVNTHSGGEYMRFTDNTIYGTGFSVHAKNISIKDNLIFPQKTGGYGILAQIGDAAVHENKYVEISGNKIYDNTTQGFGILVADVDSVDLKVLIIQNNTIFNTHGVGIWLGDSDADPIYIDNVIIEGNVITDGQSTGLRIDELVADKLIIRNNDIQNNSTTVLIDPSDIGIFRMEDNIFKQITTSGVPLDMNSGSDIGYMYVENNMFLNTDSCTNGYSTFLDADRLTLRGNHFTNSVYSGFYVDDVDSLWMEDNTFSNVTGNAFIDVSYRFTPDIKYAVSIPASGNDGDSVYIRCYFEEDVISGNVRPAFVKFHVYHQLYSNYKNHVIYDLSAAIGKTGAVDWGGSASITALHNLSGGILGVCSVDVVFNNDKYFDIILTNNSAQPTWYSFFMYSNFNVKNYIISNQ